MDSDTSPSSTAHRETAYMGWLTAPRPSIRPVKGRERLAFTITYRRIFRTDTAFPLLPGGDGNVVFPQLKGQAGGAAGGRRAGDRVTTGIKGFVAAQGIEFDIGRLEVVQIDRGRCRGAGITGEPKRSRPYMFAVPLAGVPPLLNLLRPVGW